VDELSAFIVGSLTSASAVSVIAGIAGRDSTTVFLAGVGYVALCAFGAIVMQLKLPRPTKEAMSSRQIFWLPFAPIFLTPFWIAVFVLVHEWGLGREVLRYSVISVGFLLTIPSLLLLFHLSGYRSHDKEKV